MIIYYGYLYGLLTLAGGLIGYLKAHSIPSLISGGLCGILILLSAFILSRANSAGYWGLWVMTILLLGFFTPRYLQSHSFMPAGLMIILSIGMLVLLVLFRKAVLPA